MNKWLSNFSPERFARSWPWINRCLESALSTQASDWNSFEDVLHEQQIDLLQLAYSWRYLCYLCQRASFSHISAISFFIYMTRLSVSLRYSFKTKDLRQNWWENRHDGFLNYVWRSGFYVYVTEIDSEGTAGCDESKFGKLWQSDWKRKRFA